MQKRKDYFWILFTCTVVFLAGSTAAFAFFTTLWAPQFEGTDAPIEHATSTAPLLKLQVPFDGTVFMDSFTYGLETAAWNSTLSMTDSVHAYAGTSALSVAVHAAQGGFQVTIPKSSTHFKTLTFAARNIPGGTTVTLLDSTGKDLGSQPVSWYVTGLVDQWSYVSIPLDNIGGYNRTIGALVFTSEIPFTFYLDSIVLTEAYTVADPAPVVQDAQPVVLSASALPFTANFADADVTLWNASEGLFTVGSGALTIGSATDTGAQSMATYLRGVNWTNYTAAANVEWQGDSLSLIARYASENDFVACTFNNQSSSVQIYRSLRGKYDLLTETPELEYGVMGSKQHLAITVLGDRVTCSVNGTPVLTTTTPLSPSGTVAVGTWSRVPGQYHFTLTNFTVTEYAPVAAPSTTFEGLDHPTQ